MSLSYSFLEQVVPQQAPQPQIIKKKVVTFAPMRQKLMKLLGIGGNDDTECNKIVMFFVIGVIMLAISDAFRK